MHSGVVSAALAFVAWGLFPFYFRLVSTVSAPQVLAHRIVWCLLFLLAVLAARRQWGWLGEVARKPRVLAAFAASALLISINWLTYIWAVTHDRVVDASLGYFITPLVNVLLGTTVLHERLRSVQWAALGLAGAGVLWLALQAAHPPWIALAIAGSFGAYGLLRKVAALGALEGLTLETLMLAPIAAAAIGFAAWRGTGEFPSPDGWTNLWLLGLGPITAVPLLLIAVGARQISMTTLGLLQYIGPTIQFALALWVFHEPFDAARLLGFVCIWVALVIYSADSWRHAGAAN